MPVKGVLPPTVTRLRQRMKSFVQGNRVNMAGASVDKPLPLRGLEHYTCFTLLRFWRSLVERKFECEKEGGLRDSCVGCCGVRVSDNLTRLLGLEASSACSC